MHDLVRQYLNLPDKQRKNPCRPLTFQFYSAGSNLDNFQKVIVIDFGVLYFAHCIVELISQFLQNNSLIS